MRPYLQSLGYALAGFAHAWKSERNLRLFIVLYVLSLLIGRLLSLGRMEWAFVVFSGAVFLAVELLNTALEHFSDAFDDHSRSQDDVHERAIRATKDIAAAGSLTVALAWVVTLGMVYWPHAALLIR